MSKMLNFLDCSGITEKLCAFLHSSINHTFSQSSAVPHIGNHPWERVFYIRQFPWWMLQTAFAVSNMQQPPLNNFKTSIPPLLHYFSVRLVKSIGQYKLMVPHQHQAFGKSQHGGFLFPKFISNSHFNLFYSRINWVLKMYHNKLLNNYCIKLWNNAAFIFLDQKI